MTAIDAGDIITAARRWIATPYHHQAALRGVGCDCIGLVRGVWGDVYGTDAPKPPAYTRDWGDTDNGERLILAGDTHLERIDIADLSPGDVFAIRWRNAKSAKHVGILTADDRFIHAYEKSGVVEVTLTRQWRAMIAGAWRFPPRD